MQSFTPTSRYLKAINEGTHQPDDVQREAVNRLESIYQALTANPTAVSDAKGFMARVGKLMGKKEEVHSAPGRGSDMWGGVGRGTTWRMELLHHRLPGARQQRLHSLSFIPSVHVVLPPFQGPH
ncbi:AFG1/ZapE family ATPase, partial [Klebsiella pneumoniae]